MGIRNRKDCPGYQIDVHVRYEGKLRRHRQQFNGTMADAKARHAEVEHILLTGGDPKAPTAKTGGSNALLLEAALETTWEVYWKPAGCARTQRSNMKAACEAFGADRDITTITTEDADKYIADMKAIPLAASTIASRCSCVSKMFTHFHRRGNIKTKPFFDKPKIGDNTRDRVMTDEEAQELHHLFTEVWDHTPQRKNSGARWADFITLLMDTGARESEMSVIETKNLRGSLLTLTKTKSGHRRTIPLTDRALEALERQIFQNGAQPFCWVTKGGFRHAWKWARDTMALSDDEGFIPYAMRHTLATRLYARTRDLMIVQKWLGHTEIKMTLRYAKLLPGDLENARDMLQKAM
jgi:site-specific recombinase XerD